MAEQTLKTFRARSMGEALAEVKRGLGRDAVILHTRTYKVGGWLGLGGRPIVEITASVGINVPSRDGRARAPMTRVEPRAPSIAAAVAPPVSAAAERVERAVQQRAGTGVYEVPSPSVRSARERRPCATAGGTDHAAGVEAELATIKRLMGQVLQCSRHTAICLGADGNGGAGGPKFPAPAGAMSDGLFKAYLRMLEGEVAAEIADEVVGQVRDELTPAELADESIVRATVQRRLAAVIPADADTPAPERAGDARPLTIALIGPTGVGKTTTVAKLAAAYKLRHGRKVALITSDTYRIAAVDQLRTYAEIIGLPLKVVLTPQEMSSACASLADEDVILIDTAGRSPGDAGRLDELRRFIEAARPHQTHMVLSSAASQASLLEAAQRFAVVKPDRVLFTKLDEAVNYGVLFNVARRVALRLSYVTTGQEVPDHIEQGRSDRLARLILDCGRVR